MHQFLDGKAQQAVADHLDVGYVMINPTSRVAQVYTANGRPYQDLKYAMLAWTKKSHVDVVPSYDKRQCGLLHYEDMRMFLQRMQIAAIFTQEGILECVDS